MLLQFPADPLLTVLAQAGDGRILFRLAQTCHTFLELLKNPSTIDFWMDVLAREWGVTEEAFPVSHPMRSLPLPALYRYLSTTPPVVLDPLEIAADAPCFNWPYVVANVVNDSPEMFCTAIGYDRNVHVLLTFELAAHASVVVTHIEASAPGRFEGFGYTSPLKTGLTFASNSEFEDFVERFDDTPASQLQSKLRTIAPLSDPRSSRAVKGAQSPIGYFDLPFMYNELSATHRDAVSCGYGVTARHVLFKLLSAHVDMLDATSEDGQLPTNIDVKRLCVYGIPLRGFLELLGRKTDPRRPVIDYYRRCQ